MEAFVVIALIGLGLLLAELLLPTGGVLAAIGIAGLTAAGIVALGSSSEAADYIGGALIALGLISAISFLFITRKVLAARRQPQVRTGAEGIVGTAGEARSAIDPEGRVWLGGTIWSARLAPGSGPVRLGDRVRVEAVDGLTLVVRPESRTVAQTREGAG
ncbi:MAG TPA: NfeD family protein [Solirubrobacterales bacterium]|nr:NfeD family protein [Solirubrobacterales bacterium]